MKWIDTLEIRSWAERRDCQETLPQLVRKLIRASTNSIQNIRFPSGDNVLLGGWDGILETTEGNEYLPSGISLWEFGANSDVKGKADSDFEKRSAKPVGFNPSDVTFVFVTPRLWTQKEKWIKEKNILGTWKDIKVIDAEILDEWIEVAPTVAAWLAIKHLGKYPGEGIQPTDDFWEEWSSGPKIKLNSEILLGGRNIQADKLMELISTPAIIPVQGTSREEALAFIVSVFKNNQTKEEDFFARSLIVDNPEAFRQLSVLKKPLILIPRFEDTGIINRAISNGHTVIVPLGIDSSDNWSNEIILPQIDRELFIQALSKSGVTRETAEKHSKESARNITILRRQLGFTRNLPEWAKVENVRDIIPALIVGRWNESAENDKKIIANIAGENYEDYSKKLRRWLFAPDSPFVKVGNTWRLASPLDAWINASKNFTKKDFELLRSSFLEILREINPSFELDPDKRYMASFYGKTWKFSNWIREGIIQSLILVSLYGKRLNFELPVEGETWVDKIIAELLDTDDILLWKSFQSELPLIAEASPTEFLAALEKKLPLEKSPIIALFDEETGFLTARSYYTGLLWALESIAWLPENLLRVSLVLSRLSAMDPGGNLSNRPINSLSGIFKPWYYQTLAKFEERIEALRIIANKEKEIGWTLLIRMLPDGTRDVAFPTHQMRWRLSDKIFAKPITYQEIFDTHSAAIDLLLSIFDYTESKLSNLIEESVNLDQIDRAKVLSFIEENLLKVKQSDYSAWHTIRRILSHHRSHPNTQWALPESELIRYEKLYTSLEPNDEIAKSIWMFDDNWPNFPEGLDSKKRYNDDGEKLINERRTAGLKNIYSYFGIKKVAELSLTVKEQWHLGYILANVTNDESDILFLCDSRNREECDLKFFYGFISRKCFLLSDTWALDLFDKLKAKGYGNKLLSQILIPLNQTKKLWYFIDSTNDEVKNEYWSTMHPFFYRLNPDEKIIGLNYLIQFKKYFSAINVCSHFPEEVPSELIVELLDKAATEKASEDIRYDQYQIEKLFEILEGRNDVNQQSFIKLEWLYLPILSSYGSRSPKLLHEELSKNSIFFIDVLKWLYKPKDDKLIEVERKDLTDEQILNRARQAHELLHSWKKIPGVDSSGKIDSVFLNSWVKQVREMAKECSRIEVADMNIGEVLAQYPEKDKNWPPDKICEIIEDINTQDIKSGFSIAIFNKRGVSSRGAFEGGNSERGLATHFKELSLNRKSKFPNVALILDKLSKGYEDEAKREDERAERDRLEY